MKLVTVEWHIAPMLRSHIYRWKKKRHNIELPWPMGGIWIDAKLTQKDAEAIQRTVEWAFDNGFEHGRKQAAKEKTMPEAPIDMSCEENDTWTLCPECDKSLPTKAAADACARADKTAHDSYRDAINGDDV